MQNDRTSIEKAVLTFGTIWFKLKPISRERSDRLVFSLLARSGVIFTRKKKGLVTAVTLRVLARLATC